MSERRLTTITGQIEKRVSKERRLTTIAGQIEKRISPERRLTCIAVMVEFGGEIYVRGHFGPRVQIME